MDISEGANRRKANILKTIGAIQYHSAVVMIQSMWRQRVRTAVCALAMGFAAGCGGADEAPPVANVGLTLSKTSAPLGSPIDMTYKFEMLPGQALDAKYRVFMHLLDSDGVLRWADDHDPSVPTTEWKAGTPVEYTRTSFIPVVPYLGDATIRVGLYRADATDTRAPLAGPDPQGRSYNVATLKLLPQSENVFVVHRSGYHPAEFAPENPAREWWWTQKEFVANFRNPKKDATLYLEYDARPDLFDQPQVVNVYLGSQNVATFTADNKDPLLRRIPIRADALGISDMAELRLVVEPTFVPSAIGAGQDIRELGIRVYHLFVDPS